MLNLCAPALIYVAFSLTQIIIDTFKGLYNTAFFKTIIMIIITILLNALCQSGMGIISWLIVFIPFIFMSVIVAILLYVFGLDPATGKLNIECDNCNNKSNTNNGNLVFRSTNKYMDVSYSDTPLDPVPPTDYSSDPQYQ
jgi:hypothetical protein